MEKTKKKSFGMLGIFCNRPVSVLYSRLLTSILIEINESGTTA